MNLQSAGKYVDATFGRGGHSRAILANLGRDAQLLVIDRDWDAITAAEQLAATDARVLVAQGCFGDLVQLVHESGLDKVHGVLMDLGVSSPQLDDPARGFSFLHEAELDMRMDVRSGETAAQWLNRVAEEEMSLVFWRLGEERYARRIAREIVKSRPLTTTSELVAAIERGQPKRDKNKHGATRVFQAIRMHINQESEELTAGLAAAFEILHTGGRLAVISFQSLDDRCVKQTFKAWTQAEQLPRRLPVKAEAMASARAKLVIKRQRPSAIEARENPRARTALLRVVEKAAAGSGKSRCV